MEKRSIIIAALLLAGFTSDRTLRAQTVANYSQATKSDLNAAAQARTRKDYATALRLYKKLADQDVPEAQCELGEMYTRAIGTPSRLEEGKKVLEKAAAQGNAKAEFLLSQILADIFAGGKDEESRAERLLQEAVNQGYPLAEFTLAARSLSHEKVDNANSKAWQLMKKAALHGSTEAGKTLGSYCFQHKQYAEAAKWFELSIHTTDGDRDRQRESYKSLACQYYYGWGVKKDQQKAVWLYAQGQPEALGLFWTHKMAPGAKPSPEQLAEGVRWMLGTSQKNQSDLSNVMGLMHRK